MIFNILPIICLVVSIFSSAYHACQQNLHRHPLHHMTRWNNLEAERSTSNMPSDHSTAMTCPVGLSKRTGIIQKHSWLGKSTADGNDASVQETEEDLTRIIADLNNATSEAMDYMMQLVLSIQSMSLRLSLLETSIATPTISYEYTTGTASFNGTFSSTRKLIFGSIPIASFPTPSQTVQVVPITVNGSISMSSSTSFITASSMGADTVSTPDETSTTTWTSTSTITVTVQPSFISEGNMSTSQSSPTCRLALTESSETLFRSKQTPSSRPTATQIPQAAFPSTSGSQTVTPADASMTSSRSISTSTVRTTLTILLCTKTLSSSTTNTLVIKQSIASVTPEHTSPGSILQIPEPRTISTGCNPVTTSLAGITSQGANLTNGSSSNGILTTLSPPLIPSTSHSLPLTLSSSLPYTPPRLSSSSALSSTPYMSSLPPTAMNLTSSTTSEHPTAFSTHNDKRDSSLHYSLTYFTTIRNSEVHATVAETETRVI
ncbi:hypothetical protein F5Y19DRAFT_255141 [Xylariaceae sp. FL1651]|nr:hypothetical protein F5Y19DRAFT_255141 [Xylariaceae sp. FL1651]